MMKAVYFSETLGKQSVSTGSVTFKQSVNVGTIFKWFTGPVVGGYERLNEQSSTSLSSEEFLRRMDIYELFRNVPGHSS
jgi:hypothetical protein